MKNKLTMFLIVAALCLSGIWPPWEPEPNKNRIPIPGKPPTLVVIPNSI